MATFDDFKKLEFVTAQILEVTDHPNADRLLLLKVDIGEDDPRQIVAGIKKWYRPDDLVGKTIVVIRNLEPATIRGEVSNGMMLAASHKTNEGETVVFLSPSQSLPPGCIVS